MNEELIRQFKTVRRTGVPIAGVETSDPAALIHGLLEAMNGKKDETPIVKWDLVRGCMPITQPGSDWNSSLENSQDPVAFLDTARTSLPENGLVFLLAAHKMMDQPVFVQAVWNLRDDFKASGRTLMLLGPLGWKLPIELKDDLVMLVDPLPDSAKLTSIVESISEDAGIKEKITDEIKSKTVDAVMGLSAFGAEQVVAMSLTKEGVNQTDLWNRKVKAIEQTPGLSVWRGGDSFANVGGCKNVKTFLSKLAHGKRRPKAVLFIDSISSLTA